MGKRGGARKAQTSIFGSNNSITLREETTGKRLGKGGSANVKSILKVEHLERLAVWTSGEASMPSLGAFFGHRLASAGEALGIPPNPSLFSCRRCETLLQPGFNCTIRIEKNRGKPCRSKRKPNDISQNNLVCTCHFCSHQNRTRGTPKGHMKEICPSKSKPTTKSKATKSTRFVNSENESRTKDEASKRDGVASPALSSEAQMTESPTTPVLKTEVPLLERMRKKRNRSSAKKPPEPEKDSTSTAEQSYSTMTKRKRKSWSSLKDIAKSSEHENSRNMPNLTIPFFL